MNFAPRKFLRVGGGVLKIKVTVTMADPGVAKEFCTKEIHAWWGRGLENKIYCNHGRPGRSQEISHQGNSRVGGEGFGK